jgi:hypothetical protein
MTEIGIDEIDFIKCEECGFFYTNECLNCKTEEMGIDGMDYVMIEMKKQLTNNPMVAQMAALGIDLEAMIAEAEEAMQQRREREQTEEE